MIDPLAQFFNRPPPENLLKLFSLTKKAEVKKYAAGLTVRSDDLTRMILGAGRAGFIHVPRFGESQPDDLQLSSRELDSFRGMPDGTETDRLRGKAMRKIVQMFAVRKLSAFHFFLRPPEWHLIMFTQHDSHVKKGNHWQLGTHIHFINHLWTGIGPLDIWNSFPDRPNGVHIRFSDDDLEEIGQPVDTSNGHNQSPPSNESESGRG